MANEIGSATILKVTAIGAVAQASDRLFVRLFKTKVQHLITIPACPLVTGLVECIDY